VAGYQASWVYWAMDCSPHSSLPSICSGVVHDFFWGVTAGLRKIRMPNRFMSRLMIWRMPTPGRGRPPPHGHGHGHGGFMRVPG